ncbi:M23 family metallopeptidase [Brachybacterium sp. UMB0905]|uniref:M23 family metallopeptidase n=1 Tax=Brachybacterium sp. UMB0905 TaxID=2069310 RepID=UPI001E3EDA25|nr:M23 family metallopeptidase [Brachybacterium sp. UMB0905]
MANHRAEGRAAVRKPRSVGGTHRDSCVPGGAVKVGVVGVLATATIAAPLAAAAAGIEDSAPLPAPMAQQAPQVAPQDAAPVSIPTAAKADAEVRDTDSAASRSEERTSPAEEKETSEDAAQEQEAENTGITVEVEEPEPVVEPAAEAAENGEGTADASTAPAATSGTVRPVPGPITSGYGYRIHPILGYSKMHEGVDFSAGCGTPVRSVRAGTVVAVEYNGASGNRVKVDHGNGEISGYYHLSGFATSVGATVQAGDVVGYVGSTGRSTGCHLHFAKMDANGNYSNPMSFLQ